MNRFLFWQRWLFVVGLAIALFGLAMALFSGTSFFSWLFDSRINPVFWGAENLPPAAEAFQRFIYGVLGATIAGWGTVIAFIAHVPFKNKELWAWNSLLAGLLIWYVVDTSISVYFAVYFNALFNTLLFVLVMFPLALSKNQFTHHPVP
ncbi:MAG: hypothetical protein ACE5G8_00060 [Anaerolineae bacterium]